MTTTEHGGRIPIAAPALDAGEKGAVLSVLESGHLVGGDQIDRFESEFATFCGTEHAIGTSNGTTALHTALDALGIGPGDTVLTTPFTFIATVNAIRLVGAKPVFADVDPNTLNLDPQAVETEIRARDGDIDALLVVHLYGLPADMEALTDIAEQYDIEIIEDAAQAHGATVAGKPVGSFGDAGCFSFYPTKNMTTGEGGMVVTDREDVAERARRFINHGRTDRYEHAHVGHNFRMSDLAAAIGRIQLDRLPHFISTRQSNATHLKQGLADCEVSLPPEPPEREHAYNQFTIRSSRRDALQETLDDFGIDTSIYYPRPVHQQPAYQDVDASLPVAETASSEVLSLPVHPQLSARDIDAIVTAVRYFENYRHS